MRKTLVTFVILGFLSAATSAFAVDPPQDVLAMDTGNGSVTIVWSPAGGVGTHYQIYSDKGLVETIISNTQRFIDLNPGISYYIITVVGTTRSVKSTTVSVEPNQIPNKTVISVVLSADQTQASLSWTAQEHSTSYNIHRGGLYLATVSAPGTTFSDLNPDRPRSQYTVTAVNQNTKPVLYALRSQGASVYPAPLTEGESSPEIEEPPTAALQPPSKLTATLENGVATVTWASVDNASGYNLYRDDYFIDSINAPTTSYTDYTPGTSYSAVAYNRAGRSEHTSTSITAGSNSSPNLGSIASEVRTNFSGVQGAGSVLGTVIRAVSACNSTDQGVKQVITGGSCSLVAPVLDEISQTLALTEWVLVESSTQVAQASNGQDQFHLCEAICIKDVCSLDIRVKATSVCLSAAEN